MKHTLAEINELKTKHVQMWNLVQSQVDKAFKALITYDKNLAQQVVVSEKMVNASELVMDSHCENFIALFAPVAIDLRFVISLLKINNNLERIGDFAEGISLFVLYQQSAKIDEKLFADLELQQMIDTATHMLAKTRTALIDENSTDAGAVLSMDDIIDNINRNSVAVLAKYITENPAKGVEILNLHSVMRRIERIGDRVSNIAEDVVFFVDAKELRHKNK